MLRASVVGRRAASTLALAARTERLLAAKAASGKSFDQLASDLGTTNTYAAQLLLGQAKLTDATASKLKEALPGLDDADLRSMGTCPDRSYDPFVFQDPVAYRLKEAVCHNARSIKMIINEQCGVRPRCAVLDDLCVVMRTTRPAHGAAPSDVAC